MKRYLNVTLAVLVLIGGLTGCGSNTTRESAQSTVPAATTAETTTTETTTTETTTEETTTEEIAGEGTGTGETVQTFSETEETAEEHGEPVSGSTLVVYYSASGTTKRVGDMIADALGADVFELIPVEPYTSEDLNWSNENSRVSQEHDNPDTRHVELTSIEVENFDTYDTVLIGFPIWWHSAAWVVDDFIKGNDFTGKTVIPFCTSSSSPLGDSGKELEEMAGTGNWLEGERFGSGSTEEDVEQWLKELGLLE